MELSFSAFLIVCPLVFLGGFVDSIAGGGGLITLPAYMLAGLPPHYAIGTNKLSSLIGTSVATFRMWRHNYINIGFMLPAVVAALIGSAIGARLVLMIDEKYLQYLLLFVLPLTAFYVLRKKDYDSPAKDIPYPKACLAAVIISFFLGAYDGFYGPGAGTFLILLFTSFSGMNIRTASGSAKLINLSTNISAFTVFLLNGKIIILLGLAAAVFSIAGNYLGAGMIMRKGASIVRPIIFFVLTLFLIKIIHGLLL